MFYYSLGQTDTFLKDSNRVLLSLQGHLVPVEYGMGVKEVDTCRGEIHYNSNNIRPKVGS
jgi:hypothetical protein